MATIATNTTATFGSITILSLVNKSEKTLAAFQEWRSAAKTRKELSKLTARQLEDIGLNFGDIAKIR